MGMTESKKAEAVGALRQCAKEHEKDFTYTFNIRVSDLCNDIADYLEELQKENAELKEQIEKMKCCYKCKYSNTSSFLYRLEPCNECYSYSKWELSE